VKVGTGAFGGATASLSADLDVWRSYTFDDAYPSRAVRQRPLCVLWALLRDNRTFAPIPPTTQAA